MEPGDFDDSVKAEYLDALAAFGTHLRASKHVGITANMARRARRKDPEFEEACQAALEDFRDSLEAEAIRRGRDGFDEPVFFKGNEVGTVRRYSDRMLELVLKANIPEKYNDKVQADVQVTGGVLLTVAPAQSEDNWLEAHATEELPDGGQTKQLGEGADRQEQDDRAYHGRGD